MGIAERDAARSTQSVCAVYVLTCWCDREACIPALLIPGDRGAKAPARRLWADVRTFVVRAGVCGPCATDPMRCPSARLSAFAAHDVEGSAALHVIWRKRPGPLHVAACKATAGRHPLLGDSTSAVHGQQPRPATSN